MNEPKFVEIWRRKTENWEIVEYQKIPGALCCNVNYKGDDYSFPVNRELVLFKGIIDAVAKANKLDLRFWLDYKAGKFILPHDFKKAMA